VILIPLIYVKENDVLGKSLVDKDHKILLKKGMALKKSQIKKLMELGYNNIYIISSIDYEPMEFLDSSIRDELMIKLKMVYSKMKKYSEIEKRKSSSTSILIKLDEEKTSDIKDISKYVNELVGDIMSSKKDYIDYVTIKNHENYPFNHAIDTGVLATLIGKQLNMNPRQLVNVFMAAIVSELGNASLPQALLNKKGKLEDYEYELIKQHSLNGYKTAKGCNFLGNSVKIICLEHHERIDGTGYPNKLEGSEINMGARILSVADAYDSLTSSRTYRPPYPPHKALSIIRGEATKAFDPEIVSVLSDVIVPYPIGSVVKLSSAEHGVVVGIHRDIPERPVLITVGADRPQRIDLKIDASLQIIGLRYAH